MTNTVSYDTTVAAFADGGTSPFSLNRKTFDAEASLTPLTLRAFRAGYTREQIDQTFRTFDTTTENTRALSADATGISWLMLRAVYEHAKRVGNGLRRADARRHRRAGVAAAVRHLGPHVQSVLAASRR